MSENNDNSNDSNSRPDSILQASRLNNPIRAGVLRPSVLGSSLNSSNAANSDSKEKESDENDAEIPNPFLREQNDDDNGQDDAAAAAQTESSKKDENNEEKDDRPDPINLLAKNGFERANMFAAAKNSIPRVEKSGFVFGQNVHERVTGENIHVESSTSKSDNSTASADSPLLFSSVIQAAAKPENEGAAAKESTDAKSLTEVAREYEESRAQKRKFEEVETFTGEEDEVNIVDISCKLFAFVNSNWEERGRGSLRLNDSKTQKDCSRVVFRTSGNLRLLVNTKVWAGMVAERPSQKSMRLTAMDNTGQIKVFLVMSRPVDISNLHMSLVSRIEMVKILNPTAADCDNSNDEKNGSADKCEVAAAANVPAPSESAHADGDGESEPSPKKSFVATAAAAAESD